MKSTGGLQALKALQQVGSLTLAADMLGVTRSALSHRIAVLEQELGIAMVCKNGRKIELTDDADALLLTMGDALERIEASVKPLLRRRSQLRISTVGTFASHWLLPRVAEFQRLHPDIEIALTTSRRTVDLATEDFDCAIRHGTSDWPGLTSSLLFRESLVPVAAPGVQHDLHDGCIIRARSRFQDWNMWWKASGMRGKPSESGLLVDTRAQALEAALAGAGIAAMDNAYIGQHLSTDRLRVAGPSVALKEGYYLVHRPTQRNGRLNDAFKAWILDASSSHRSASTRIE
jgi:DNA-binding transcriptional LysR family regulator